MIWVNMMNLSEAKDLKINDIVTHKFLKTKYKVIETRLYKTNPGRFRHTLQEIGRYHKYTFTEKGLKLWTLKN
jgi:hypothetical protein